MPVDVELIKQRHPIADVMAAHGVTLRPTGRRFMGRCPFHEDDRPSLVVYPDTRSFHCFGCGAQGDVIDFIRRARGLGFRDAVACLGELPEGEVPVRAATPPTAPPASSRLSLDDRLILTAACELYHEALLRTPHALRYLEERGIPDWLVRRARLGYSDGATLQPFLKRRRLSIRRAIELGLLYPERQGGEREALRGRLVIPDLRAGYCAWMTGRALATGAQAPYLSLALPRPLLGYDGVSGRKRIFLTEGPFDWLTLRAWGLPACALLGSQPGERTLRLLHRFASIVLVLDHDAAGRAAAESLQAALGDRAVAVELPEAVKDVNELARLPDGRESFFRLLDVAEGRPRDVAQAH
jgi:DNA primase